jgi:hypothetical protein
MKKSELKKMIKPLIRECLTEIFMEMNLETIVEGIVKEHLGNKKVNQINEVKISPPPPSSNKPEMTPEERKRIIRENLAIDEDEWRNVYADTVKSGNPILESDEGNNSKPEYASEDRLKEAGLYRDYSKFT